MTTPRLAGRTPSQRFLPALPKVIFHDLITNDPTGGTAANVYFAKLAAGETKKSMITFFCHQLALAPAERTICPPLPIFNSTLCITVPRGILISGRQLPILISDSGPLVTMSPTFNPLAQGYSASHHLHSAGARYGKYGSDHIQLLPP